MNLSYWEYKTWYTKVDYTIIGSGIVGLNCALHIRERFPNAKILVLEKGRLPQGASTKNAGFACYGSISEILSDLKNHTEEEVLQLVQRRWEGIEILRTTLGDNEIGYFQHGGHEVFLKQHTESYEHCLDKRAYVNELLYPVFKQDAFTATSNEFNFQGISEGYISNSQEGQLDAGLMMRELLSNARKKGIEILNSVTVEGYTELNNKVVVKTTDLEFETDQLFIATNGFASELIGEQVAPARAQVLITKPLDNLRIRGTFHFDKGFYYFRNIDNRILLGGGRNTDFVGEQTTEFGITEKIQNRLEELLREIIIPGIPFEIATRWSGIMGVGMQKKPIIKALSENVYCGVRLGGMGIAIGSYVGKELAGLYLDS